MKPRKKSTSTHPVDTHRRKRRIGPEDRRAFEIKFAIVLGAITVFIVAVALILFR